MISDNFKEECKNRAYANRLGKIKIDGVDLPITNSDNLQKITIDSSCYADGNIIGTIYVKKLTGEFIAYNENANFVDKSLNAQIGVKYGDNTTEYIEMGKYNIHSINNEKTANMSQIVAYDDLINKIDEIYVCGIDYANKNITLKDLYIDVCNQLELTPKTTEFINSDIPISNNPFKNNERNRVVLQTILKISCSFAVIDNIDNQIDLCWLSTNENPDYTFQKNDYSTLEGGLIKYGPINSLTIKNSQVDDENVTVDDKESIELNGENSLVISEDYILYTPELRQMAIDNIFNRIKGLTYYESKLITYYGKPFLPLGSKIRIMLDENDYIDTYVLKHYFEYDGTFISTIESPVLSKEEIKVKQNENSLAQKLYNTAINIDKQNQVITMTVEELASDLKDEQQVIDDLNNAINTINSTMLEQTSRAFTMWFEETGLQDTIDNVSNQINSNQNDLNTIKEYIQFEGAKITLGKSTSPYKVTIQNDEIAFWAGDTKCAYISQNKLFINQIVVVNQFQRGYFLDEVDDEGYLDLYWVGD